MVIDEHGNEFKAKHMDSHSGYPILFYTDWGEDGEDGASFNPSSVSCLTREGDMWLFERCDFGGEPIRCWAEQPAGSDSILPPGGKVWIGANAWSEGSPHPTMEFTVSVAEPKSAKKQKQKKSKPTKVHNFHHAVLPTLLLQARAAAPTAVARLDGVRFSSVRFSCSACAQLPRAHVETSHIAR